MSKANIKNIVKREEEPYVIRFTNDRKYKRLVLKLLNIIERDNPLIFDYMLDKFLEILKAKVKSKEEREKLAEKVKEILKDFEEKSSVEILDKTLVVSTHISLIS